MNEPQFGNRIRQGLNRRATQISPQVLERLRAGREQALFRQKLEQPERAVALAGGAGRALSTLSTLSTSGDLRGWDGFSLRWILPAVVLVAGLGAIYSWQQTFRVAEVEEVDARLLTDDLPIDAYLDKGFQAWLKKRAAEQ
jgi:hypothetical protein